MCSIGGTSGIAPEITGSIEITCRRAHFALSAICRKTLCVRVCRARKSLWKGGNPSQRLIEQLCGYRGILSSHGLACKRPFGEGCLNHLLARIRTGARDAVMG